jgi:hypothetical protein
MPIHRIKGPDGRIHQIKAPAGAKPQEIVSFLASQLSANRQATQTAAQQQILKKRYAELDKEERAAQKRLDRITSNTEKYLNSTLGKVVGAPAKLFGAKTTAEEALDVAKAERQETIERINRERAFIAREGRVAPTPTFGERVAGTLKSIPRGAIEGTSQALGTLGVFGSEGEQTARAAEERGTAFAKSLGLGASETAEFDPMQRNLEAFGGGLGSVIPYLGAEVVGQRLKPLTKAAPYVARGAQAILGSGQGASQARQQMDDFEKETGQKIDPTTRKLVQAGGGAIGLTELLPVGRMLDSLPGPIKTAVNKRITDIVAQTGAGKLVPEAARTAIRETLQAVESRAVGRIVTRGALPEALQEGGTQLAQNVLERTAYNPDQDVMENVAENAILGGLVGGTVRGGVEITNALGKRAADNRKKYFEQIAAATAPIEEFDINVGSYEDPSQLTRQKIQRISEPDANGDVFARRADGTIYQTSLKELYRMRAPTGGIRAVPIPDTLSAPALTQRLVGALGNVEPDSDIQSYINSVTTTLNNNMALGTPEKTETYLQKQQNGLRRARISEEAKIARMLVLDEAVRLNNEYVDLVTAPPEGTDPNVDQAVINEPPTPLSDEEIQSQIDTMRRMREQRVEALNVIASDPNYLDKVETFEALMVQNGFDAPTTVEVAALYDAMRAESDAETAAGQEKDTSERQQLVDRINIIESVLYDDRIPTGREEEILAAQEAIDAQIAAERAKLAAQPNKNIPAARRAIKNIEALEARRAVVGKAESIDAKLRKKGYKPLYRHEIERIGGFEAANAVFGPEGEYTQRRQALLDQVLADPTITDKYRGFTELLDQNPALGDPTIEETRMLRGDAAPLEAQIAESAEPITTAQLSAEPGGLTEEGIVDGQLEGEVLRDKPKRDADARAAINELIAVEQAKLDEAQRVAIGESADQVAINQRIAVEQAKLDAEPNKSTPAARRAINAIKALTKPYKSTPAARRAINAIKALEAERDALGEAPVADEVVQDEAPEGAVNFPIENITRANGAIGTQGVTAPSIRSILNNVLGMNIPTNATMREMVDALKADKAAQDRLRQFTRENPIDVQSLPDGTYQVKDGHHRAFLHQQLGDGMVTATIDQKREQPDRKSPSQQEQGPAELPAPPPVAKEAPVAEETPVVKEAPITGIGSNRPKFTLDTPVTEEAAPVVNEAPTALEAIDAQIAVEQEKLDAAPNLGAPVARRAINAIKALETERAAIEEAAPIEEEAAPVAEEAVAEETPVAEEVVQETVQEEAAPVVEETLEPTEAEQAVHIQLTEGEKDVLAEHYEQPEYNDVAKSRFIQDLVLAINNGLQAVSKKIRGIVKRIQVLTLATSVVFNANPLTMPSIPQTQAQAIVYNETLHRSVPTAARGEMSAEAQRVYEIMAPVAIKTGKSFFIADKPNGMIHAFAGNGSYMVSAPSLYGKAAGDVLTETRTQAEGVASVKDSDRITPAGVYRMGAGKSSKYTGGYVLYLNNPETGAAVGANEAGGGAIVAVHSVFTTSGTENRQGRLDTATASDNKISFGCINTAEDFFLDSVLPNIDSFDGGMVFIMPDDASKTGQYFTGEQQQKQQQQPSTPQEEQQKQVGILPGQKGLRQTRKEKKPDGKPTPPPPPPAPVTEQPAPTTAKQTINNPEEDISPVEEQLEADPTTVEGTFPASLNRPRAEAIGFAADLERRVKSIRSRLRRKLEGKYKTAYDYSRALSAAYGVTKLPADLDVARKFELLESRKIGGQMQLNRWYLQPIEDKMIELGVDPDDAAMYFWARSAPARNALVRERNGEQNGSGMSDAQAQAKLDQLEIEGLGPKLREIAKLHDALVDYMGNQRVKAGLLSKEAWRAMRKAQPFYTPLKGYALDGDMQVDGEPNPHSDAERGIAKRNGTRVREVLTTRGRKSIPFNPLYNLMADAQFAIARIEQNKVKQTFLNNILSDPESHKDLVTVYTPKKKTHPSGHVTMPKIGSIGNGKSGPVDMNKLAAQADAKLMIVKKDGEPYYIEFTETPAANALYRLFGNMTPKQINPFFKGIDFQVDGKSYHIPGTIEVANTLKSFKTRFSPVFTLLVAPLRDIKEAITTAYIAQGIKGGPAEGTKLGKRTARYIASLDGLGTISNYLRGNDPTTAEGQLNALLFDQFLGDGGAVGHALVMESERYAQNVAKNIKRYAALKRGNPGAAALKAKDMVAGALDHVSQLLDLHMRFATYRAALEQNISREDAAALALDSTLDMTRRGELGPQLDSWAFFFSPTIGGARKLLSQGRYSAIARKLFTKLIGTGMLIYLFNRFGPGAGDDDEDGRPNILEVNNATAQTRVILRGGPGINDYVSVPTAFGIGFFNYLGGQIMATILGDIQPTEAATNIVGGLISLASPIKTEGTEGLTGIVNFAMPDTGQWGYDLIVNRSAFGSPIYTEQEYSTLPKSELGREETGEVWKFVARGINSLFGGTRTVESVGGVQPEQYRYIAQQLLGGAYTFSRDIVDAVSGEAKPEQTTLQRIPLVKTFVGKGGEYAPMNKFYEDYDTLRSIHSTYIKSGEDPEAWAENEAAYPVQTDSRVMDAFDTALSAIRAINDDARGGAYDTSQEKYAALNDVYKEFNKTYSEVKKAK